MIQALILDLDGTLVESQGHWRAAEARLFERLGGTYDARVAQIYQGMTAFDVGQTIHAHLKPTGISASQSGAWLRTEVLDAPLEHVYAMPSADEFLIRASGLFPLAIASSSPRILILKIVEHFGWWPYLRCVVSSEEVANGKPAPDVFLEAAKRLGYAPTRCLVVEDSLNGVLAAKQAGMRCCAVNAAMPGDLATRADRIVGTLTEVLKDIS